MSVINRMLADLEERDAPAARGPDALAAAGERPRRRRSGAAVRRLLPAALALALVTVAAVLWLQRGPALLAWLAPADPGPPAADEPVAAADEIPLLPALVGLELDADDEGERVVLVGERPPEVEPVAALRPGAGVARPGEVAGADAAATGDGPPGDPAPATRGAQPAGAAGDAPADADAQTPAEADAAGEAGADGEPGRTAADAGGASGSDDRAGAASADTTAAADDPEPDGGTAASRGGGEAAAAEAARAGAVRKVERTSPTVRAQRRYRGAREALSGGDLAVAHARLRGALDADPDLHGARELLAALLRRADDAAAARDVLAEGVERAPGRPGFAKPYARLLVDSGELERAAQVLEPAAQAAADDPGYHALVAAIAQRLGRHERANQAYTRALEIDAGHGRWWLGLGISLAATEHPREARAAFREARATGDLTPRLDSWAKGRMEALGNDGER